MPDSSITKSVPSHLQEPIIPSPRGETQPYGTVRRNPLALDANVATASVAHSDHYLLEHLVLGLEQSGFSVHNANSGISRNEEQRTSWAVRQ